MMRFAMVMVGLALGTIALPMMAQAEALPTVSEVESPAAGADVLQTQPAGVSVGDRPNSVYSPQVLQQTAKPLQANPPRPKRNLIEQLTDALEQPTAPQQVDPLEFFAIPALDSGVSIPVRTD